MDSRRGYAAKPLYGHHEGAEVGYNPKKPGSPSHGYHTYSMAGARLVFDVDVCAGNQHTSNHGAPGGLLGAEAQNLAIEQTGGRRRIDIRGAIDLETRQNRRIEAATIDAMSTICFRIL